jgi:hypothetical protein
VRVLRHLSRGLRLAKGQCPRVPLSRGPLFLPAVSANDRHCAAQKRQSADYLTRINLGGRHLMPAMVILNLGGLVMCTVIDLPLIVVTFAVVVSTECRQCSEGQECRCDERLGSCFGRFFTRHSQRTPNAVPLRRKSGQFVGHWLPEDEHCRALEAGNTHRQFKAS